MSDADPVSKRDEENAVPSPAKRKFVGIANARVVVTADSLDEVLRRLDETGGDRQEMEIWEEDPESGKVGYVWTCRRLPPERAGYVSERSLYAANPVMQRNAELARQINEEARRNPQSPYAGKFVGIANGQVVVASADLQEVGRYLDGLPIDPLETFVVEASRDYDRVEYIGCWF
jgi:hypothetical protein